MVSRQNPGRIFAEELGGKGRAARALAGLRLAAVGPATSSALLDVGLAVDVSPNRFVAEGLLDALRDRRDIRGARVLYVRAQGARETLAEGLDDLGAVVDQVVLYRSVADGEGADELRAQLEAGD